METIVTEMKYSNSEGNGAHTIIFSCGLLYFTSSPVVMGSSNGWKNKSRYSGMMRRAHSRLSNSDRRASVSLRLSDCILLSTAKLFRVFAAIKMTTVICGDAAGWRPKGFRLMENLLLTSVFNGNSGQCCFSLDSHLKRISQIDYWIETLHVVKTWRITSE